MAMRAGLARDPSSRPQVPPAPMDHQAAGGSLTEEAMEIDNVISEVRDLSGRIRIALLGEVVEKETRAPSLVGSGLLRAASASLHNSRMTLQDAREALREIAQEVGA